MSKTPSDDKVFRNWQRAAAFVHYAFAIWILVEVLDSPWEAPTSIRFSNWTSDDPDERCSGSNVCIIQEGSVDTGTFNVGILVPLFSLISGTHHLIAGVWNGYIDDIQDANRWRAIDYALSSSLMIVVASILFRSPPDPTVLVFIAAVQILVNVLGYTIEVLSSKDASDSTPKVLFATACVVYAAVWVGLLLPFGYAVEDAPAAVVVFIVYMVTTFSSFPIVAWISIAKGTDLDPIEREYWYTALSFLAKVPLLVLFYFGVIMRSGTVEFEGDGVSAGNTTHSQDEASDATLYGVFVSTIVIGIILSIVIIRCPDLKSGNGNSGSGYNWIYNPMFNRSNDNDSL